MLSARHQLAKDPGGGGGSLPISVPQFSHTSPEWFGLCLFQLPKVAY